MAKTLVTSVLLLAVFGIASAEVIAAILSPQSSEKIQARTKRETQDPSEGRSNVIQIGDLGELLASKTTNLIGLPGADLGGALATGFTVLVLSLWITLFVYLFQGYTQRRSDEYNYYNNYYDPYGYEQRSPPLTDRVSRVLEDITESSFRRLVNSLNDIDPRPSIRRMGTGAVQTIKQSTDLVSQSLVNGVYILSQMGDLLAYVPDLMSGGVERVSDSFVEANVQDCILQSVCYLSAPESDYLQDNLLKKRMLSGVSSQFEGRKKKDKKAKNKKKEEKRKRKEEKKKRKEEKRKQEEEAKENDEYDYDYEYYDDDDDYDNDNDDDDDDVDDKEDDGEGGDEILNLNDCEVFKCAPVKVGHSLFSLYSKINAIRSNAIGDISELEDL